MTEAWAIFSEVRLHASSACRAWTETHGCFSAPEWESALTQMPILRGVIELGRLRISEALSVDGIDPLGILRKLLIHESVASLSRSWLRETGFVHLEVASGIHLYAIWRAADSGLRPLAERLGLGLTLSRNLRIVLPLLIWFSIFALEGFRPGLWRPLFLVSFRWGAERFGFRWSRGVTISIALLIDALFGLTQSFGRDQTFAEWAPGELHYALSWWGGILGYEWARARESSKLGAHFALSFCSWLAVLPVDLLGGHFALLTPVLSLLTVEFLVRGGYVAAVVLGVAFASTGFAGAREGLQWLSFCLNHCVGWISEAISRAGLVRNVGNFAGVCFALMVISGVVFYLRRVGPPIKTSIVSAT